MKKISLGSDHGGYTLKETIKLQLAEMGCETTDHGAFSQSSVDYAEIAESVCADITSGKSELAILCCGTGIGMSMAANKINGIRAACCSEQFSARMTREHNDANVLCLGERTIGPGLAADLVKIFVETEFSNEERHTRRIAQITALENK